MAISKRIIFGAIATVLGSTTVGVEAKNLRGRKIDSVTTNENETKQGDNCESAESLLQLRKMDNSEKEIKPPAELNGIWKSSIDPQNRMKISGNVLTKTRVSTNQDLKYTKNVHGAIAIKVKTSIPSYFGWSCEEWHTRGWYNKQGHHDGITQIVWTEDNVTDLWTKIGKDLISLTLLDSGNKLRNISDLGDESKKPAVVLRIDNRGAYQGVDLLENMFERYNPNTNWNLHMNCQFAPDQKVAKSFTELNVNKDGNVNESNSSPVTAEIETPVEDSTGHELKEVNVATAVAAKIKDGSFNCTRVVIQLPEAEADDIKLIVESLAKYRRVYENALYGLMDIWNYYVGDYLNFKCDISGRPNLMDVTVYLGRDQYNHQSKIKDLENNHYVKITVNSDMN